jgi:hypothetical protein
MSHSPVTPESETLVSRSSAPFIALRGSSPPPASRLRRISHVGRLVAASFVFALLGFWGDKPSTPHRGAIRASAGTAGGLVELTLEHATTPLTPPSIAPSCTDGEATPCGADVESGVAVPR